MHGQAFPLHEASHVVLIRHNVSRSEPQRPDTSGMSHCKLRSMQKILSQFPPTTLDPQGHLLLHVRGLPSTLDKVLIYTRLMQSTTFPSSDQRLRPFIGLCLGCELVLRKARSPHLAGLWDHRTPAARRLRGRRNWKRYLSSCCRCVDQSNGTKQHFLESTTDHDSAGT